ncbi:MAG: glycosyltransferase [Deltaproteobacteria bacterium]|nr:glycosyltransferase [Deltaproteobacteria bacterium]
MSKQVAWPFKLSVLMPVYNERFLVAAAIQRVLDFRHPLVGELELIVVDDGSTDGTAELLAGLARQDERIRYLPQPRNRGKGAALRVAIAAASGELTVIQDADLEYSPEDWGQMLPPFVEANADAVYGSRFLTGAYRRVLFYRHTLGNRLLTLFSNLMTDLNLTDMETCYKMVRTQLLQSIPIRASGFDIEPELTAKLAKRGALIYEVPIRYAGRTYLEGKKIDWRDGVIALGAILRWKLLDDLYHDDEAGKAILGSLSHVQEFNRWMAELLLQDVGRQVLEVGAGMGSLTIHLLPRDRYLATDIDEHHLSFLENLALGKPYLEVRRLDLLDEAAFRELAGQFDTVICLNVLEHVADPRLALRNLHTVLQPGGRAILLVPQGKWLYSSLDRAVGHEKRYAESELLAELGQTGFALDSLRQFNRAGVLAWVLNGLLLRRRHLSRLQLKTFDTLTPLLERVDRFAPWPGLSLIAVARKPS